MHRQREIDDSRRSSGSGNGRPKGPGGGFALYLYIAGILSRDDARDLLRSLGAADANS